MIELKLQWIHSGKLLYSSMKHSGTTLHHRHQSRMLNGTPDAGGKFGCGVKLRLPQCVNPLTRFINAMKKNPR